MVENDSRQRYALLVQQSGKAQKILAKFVTLLLNYSYGLHTKVVPDSVEAAAAFRELGEQISCCFVIQNENISNATISALSQRDTIPLFVLVPKALISIHRKLLTNTKKGVLCAWEGFSGKDGTSLRQQIANVFKENSVSGVLGGEKDLTYEELQMQVERKIGELKTLPTLPEVVMRILRVVNDPNGTMKELEQVLFSDPSIVQKLVQVFNSAAIAGSARQKKMTFQEGIVRLGTKNVGAIAMQVKMMNSFARPEESNFDLQGFWEHSIACALVSDMIYKGKLVTLKKQLEFNDYWVAAILHDVGKLIMGFHFWEHFEQILNHMGSEECSYHDAELQFDDVPNHEYVGKLVMLKSNVGEELVTVVGSHHSLGAKPSALQCLLHVADNICKDLGRGYLPDESGQYDANVLGVLGLDETKLQEIQDSLDESLDDQINEIVAHCMQ